MRIHRKKQKGIDNAPESQKTFCFVGNFNRNSVFEPEVANSLEELGHRVIRVQERQTTIQQLKRIDFDVLLFAKFRVGTLEEREAYLKELKKPKIAWIPDLYWGMQNYEEL